MPSAQVNPQSPQPRKPGATPRAPRMTPTVQKAPHAPHEAVTVTVAGNNIPSLSTFTSSPATEVTLAPEQVTELQQQLQKACEKSLHMVGTKAFRAHLRESMQTIEAQNLLIMEHSRPRAVLLDYETYQSMTQIVRQLAFLLPAPAPEPQGDELAALEARRKARKNRLRGE